MISDFRSVLPLLRVWSLLLLLLSGMGHPALAKRAPAEVRHTTAAQSSRPFSISRAELLHQEALDFVTSDISAAKTNLPLVVWPHPQEYHEYRPAPVAHRLPTPPVRPRLLQARRLLLALAPNAP
ncbi:hypothetical protein [Hymenobacter psychrotolerans]|uniref:Uncharacterized protein n=1 Tax=Hymenobacter psychrotolerans DSM 18569 TaxID=1121959 RepID=A0A1M6TRB6_9BACT|nr:hypothetical protein [Hymenobacter psychrotolerans]SHK59474.1 hypothetical protein SAMN02746009_01198 [Hymenobacter psychrotolerans DSM 18569]